MRFGSVEFFKALIKTVLAILFFVPLIIAVILGVFLVKKNNDVKALTEQNSEISELNGILLGEKSGTAVDFRNIFEKSGVSYEEFLALINEKENIDAETLYNEMSKIGISDADIIAAAVSKGTLSGESLYNIMTSNGISDKDLLMAVIRRNGGSTDGFYSLLKSCGLSDSDIAKLVAGTYDPPNGGDDTSNTSDNSDTENSQGDTSSDVNSSGNTSSPNVSGEHSYEALYPDMYVDAPESYVREEGTIYMTFDDGPSQYTYSILYTLKNRNVKATFFVVPNRSEACAETLRQIAADGHAIGVHSASHEYEKIYASVEAFLEDFHEAWDIIYQATGQKTQIFRFPGGSKNDYDVATRDAIIAEMTRRGFRYFDWNVESGDIAGKTWTEMYNSIPTDIEGKFRSFVLMHDTSKGGLYVLDDVLKVLINAGYKFDRINNDTQPVQFVGPFA